MNSVYEHITAFKVLAINVAIICGITLADFSEWLKVISLLLAISYTGWKFYRDYNKKEE